MFVLIHGGGHSARCWEPVLALLDAPAVALDLPGRGVHPMPLDRVHLADWVRVAAGDIAALGRDDIVLVGHSMAGLSIAGIIDRVHTQLRHVALMSCVIPPHGQSLLDMLHRDRVGSVGSRRDDQPSARGGIGVEHDPSRRARVAAASSRCCWRSHRRGARQLRCAASISSALTVRCS